MTFDVDWQNFTQRTDVGLEWSRGQGSVVTAGHGPQGDHTSGKETCFHPPLVCIQGSSKVNIVGGRSWEKVTP